MSDNAATVKNLDYKLTPEQERKRLKRLIKQGKLPRLTIKRTVVGEGADRRTEWRFVDTITEILGEAPASSSSSGGVSSSS